MTLEEELKNALDEINQMETRLRLEQERHHAELMAAHAATRRADRELHYKELAMKSIARYCETVVEERDEARKIARFWRWREGCASDAEDWAKPSWMAD